MSGATRTDDPAEMPETEADRPQRPGRQALLLAAATIGLVMLALQLWFLTIALDLFYLREQSGAWALAVLSGLVYVGGLLALGMFEKSRRVR